MYLRPSQHPCIVAILEEAREREKRLFASIVENDRSHIGSEEAVVPCWYVAGHVTFPLPVWLSLSWPAVEDRFCAAVADF
jgi:hypothetical protein